MVHNITLKRLGEVFYFASIDGEAWLPISRPLIPGEEDEFQAVLDGDGNMRPLRFARRWFSFQSPDESEMEVDCDCEHCRALAAAWSAKLISRHMANL